MSIQDELKSDLVPWYLMGPIGGSVVESMSAVADMAVETQIQGLQQSDPLRCDESALPYIGRDRGIRRYPTESTDSYRQRLVGWREMKRHWGSIYAQIKQLQLWFSPNRPMVRAVHQSGDGNYASWHTIDQSGNYTIQNVTPSNWDWDSEYGLLVDSDTTSEWSRYWVIVYVNGLDHGSLIDVSRWDAGALYSDQFFAGHAYYDGFFSNNGDGTGQIPDMLLVLRDWKAAHSELWGLIFAKDPASFDPSSTSSTEPGLDSTTLPVGNWRFSTDPTTGNRTRLSTAIFAYDRGNA